MKREKNRDWPSGRGIRRVMGIASSIHDKAESILRRLDLM